jgi:hypothetical protein
MYEINHFKVCVLCNVVMWQLIWITYMLRELSWWASLI